LFGRREPRQFDDSTEGAFGALSSRELVRKTKAGYGKTNREQRGGTTNRLALFGENVNAGKETFALLMNQELVTRTVQSYENVSEGTQGAIFSEFTFLRKEDQMRPPMQSYAYARIMLPAIEEEQAINRVHEKDVIEIVRKEIETLMSSKSPIAGLSRTDYSRITDEVWSSLSRRLMIEKERLGRR
jgi:hypothetical protein